MNMIFETERLFARKLTKDDFGSLCRILQDPEVMYAYEHAFSDAEVNSWLERQLKRYVTDGFGLWAVILKETESMIGQCGLTMQDWNGKMVPEIGYLFESLLAPGLCVRSGEGMQRIRVSVFEASPGLFYYPG